MGTPLGPKYIPYTYMDPLGSEVNDFLDMAINYSIVACWGVLYPPMVTIASVALFLDCKIIELLKTPQGFSKGP